MLSCCFHKTHRLVGRPARRRLQSSLPRCLMTKEEYEKEYSAAIDSLEQRGHRVGSPYVSQYGVRSVRIDGFPWTDDAVFEEVWGKV